VRDPLVLVLDIRDAVEDALEFAREGREEFFASKKTQYSIIRALEIMGEAAKGLPAEFRERWRRVPWKQLAGFRDVLIHQYQRVDLDLVWQVVAEELPRVREAIEQVLRETAPTDAAPGPP
jgi:uncharacterized protein with HEPN domain